ncbi:phage tail protein [Pseudomonas sp. PS02288]|uniref:phage tail protein n=1 Tax=Pseudomonas sp. PS02288 TaxID=2991443 RepID=UPI00249A9F1C|nr:phage tail protein [Pseudomonas sp. PS02288]
MSDKYVGNIVLELNGTEYEVSSFEPTTKTGRTVVKTMNKTGRPAGTAKGIEEHELRISVPIPKTGEPEWRALVDAKLTVYPVEGGGLRETYTGVSLVEVGSKYQVEGEATRDLSCIALNYYTE